MIEQVVCVGELTAGILVHDVGDQRSTLFFSQQVLDWLGDIEPLFLIVLGLHGVFDLPCLAGARLRRCPLEENWDGHRQPPEHPKTGLQLDWPNLVFEIVRFEVEAG